MDDDLPPPPPSPPPPPPADVAHPAALEPVHTQPVPAGAAETVILQIGDIGVSPSWIVTPNGTAPLAGSAWIGRDMSRTERKTPSWAIVVAIIGFWLCLIPLLFLMVKEDVTTGYFEVSVRSGNLQHVTQLPVSDVLQLASMRQLVHQAQSMAAYQA